MSKPLRRHPDSERELFDAIDWYDERAQLGAELLAALRDVQRRIREAPESFPSDPVLANVRLARVARFPYRVVFADLGDAIFVLAIAHVRRRPGYWRDRVPREEP